MGKNIWDYDPKIDTSKSFEAFSLYLSLEIGSRSHARVGQILGKSQNQISKWAAEDNWTERALAYDAHLLALVAKKARSATLEKQRNSLEQFRKAADSISRQQIKIIKTAQDLAEAELMVRQELEDGTVVLKPKKMKDINLAKVERLAGVAYKFGQMNPFETWARALQIDKMQRQIDLLEANAGS